MAFQAHLVITIKERSFTQATRVAWELAERLRAEGRDAYVTAVNKPGLAPTRQRRRVTSQPKSKTESASS